MFGYERSKSIFRRVKTRYAWKRVAPIVVIAPRCCWRRRKRRFKITQKKMAEGITRTGEGKRDELSIKPGGMIQREGEAERQQQQGGRRQPTMTLHNAQKFDHNL